ncbi:hypothetical protein [Asticcacaulis machinosus]|uniref:Uncharacterized protein n=1 Tax=Asticcacaulis machinosus TaxID=2984211 RepID=A0ABT5HMQ0_9CAUL|nr:hypothetical protein [Asticcacaulis machinosus]MDC7677527.1 hypothetical protein [Asticcacaulis machinosus]
MAGLTVAQTMVPANPPTVASAAAVQAATLPPLTDFVGTHAYQGGAMEIVSGLFDETWPDVDSLN